jgi:hypothetical protein
MNSKRTRRLWLRVAGGILCFFVIGFLLRPSRMPDPDFRKTVDRGNTPYSGMWEENFEVKRPISRFWVQTNLKGHAGDLRIDIEEESGLQYLHGFPIERGLVRFSCGKDVHGVYTVRVREVTVTGKYTIEIGGKAAVTRWQKLLMLLVSLFAVSGVLSFWQHRRSRTGRPVPVLAGARFAFLSIGLFLFVLFFYLLFHEGGHALASISFGSFDCSMSDFFGLHGFPHSSMNPEVVLTGWPRAIISIAGPLLPILMSYVLFVLWRSRWGTDLRGKSVLVDVFWSFTIFTFLVSCLGLLIPVIHLSSNSDYTSFVNHVPLARWQADGLLLLVVLANGYLLSSIVPHRVILRRRLIGVLAVENAESNMATQNKTEQTDAADV